MYNIDDCTPYVHRFSLFSWQKDVVFGTVSLSVCLFACLLVSKITQKKLWTDCDEIIWRGPGWWKEELMKFCWWSGSSWMSKWAKKLNNSWKMPWWSPGGAGTDPEASGLAFHHQGPTFINAYCEAATNLVDQDWGLTWGTKNEYNVHHIIC